MGIAWWASEWASIPLQLGLSHPSVEFVLPHIPFLFCLSSFWGPANSQLLFWRLVPAFRTVTWQSSKTPRPGSFDIRIILNPHQYQFAGQVLFPIHQWMVGPAVILLTDQPKSKFSERKKQPKVFSIKQPTKIFHCRLFYILHNVFKQIQMFKKSKYDENCLMNLKPFELFYIPKENGCWAPCAPQLP